MSYRSFSMDRVSNYFQRREQDSSKPYRKRKTDMINDRLNDRAPFRRTKVEMINDRMNDGNYSDDDGSESNDLLEGESDMSLEMSLESNPEDEDLQQKKRSKSQWSALNLGKSWSRKDLLAGVG